MDIVVLALALIAALLLPRPRALVLAAVAWGAGVAMVAWGPAHNDNVDLGSAGFWVPWLIVGALCVGIVLGTEAMRRRRAGDAAR
jgi:hypothetical protein